MLEYIKCLIVLLFAAKTIKCESCVTYDFGVNFYNSFSNDNLLCDDKAKWNLGNYSSIYVESPHQETELFISPDEVLSCVSSYEFEMKSGGILEAYVYMESKSILDQLVVVANEVSNSGNTVATGMAMLTPLSNDYFNGWHVLRINLFGPAIFMGYVSFLGIASPASTLIVDSFRYIPPLYDEDCYIYDGELVTNGPLQSTQPTETEECITYDFEVGYNDLFNSDKGICVGFSQWILGNYTYLPIDKLSTESEHYISPQAGLSCVSSFDFKAKAEGVLEVNIYMEATESSDQIVVLVHQIMDAGNDAVVGIGTLTPQNGNYAEGWNALRIVLIGTDTYSAYISFMGSASEASIIVIDSFRYISPTLGSEDCKIYPEVFETTTVVPDTTVAPIGTGNECITFNFESNYENSFNTKNLICNGYSFWHLGNYYSMAIDPLSPSSNTFIAPNKTSSCVSSFIFRMVPGGTVEVNVYMTSASDLDYIIVLVKKVVAAGIDTVSGFELYYASDEKFIEGWNVLKVDVHDFSIFNGYITLIGSTVEESVVLVDSFRYIPPSYTESCDIY